MRLIYSLLLFISLTLASCSTTEEPAKTDPGLKDYYRDYFTMGVSVGPRNFSGPDSALIVREFGSITAENIMKPGPIHPEENRYNWEDADQLIAFADAHGLKVRGHTLCWHNQVGAWMFEDENGQLASDTLLLRRLRDHIFAVAGRYQDQVYAWDVVNEAIADADSVFYRNSSWYEICGASYIAKAFAYAHEAAPNAQLFYNDYNAVQPGKRDKIIRMIRELQSQGVPIHGVGIQGHWSIYGPDEATLRAALDAYATLGIPVHITELDVSVYPSESGRREKRPDESDAFTPELEQRQIEQYRMIFKVFRDYKDLIDAVTFWNVSDHHSWLDNFPVRGRKNYPLLFDQNRQRKKAYEAVTSF